LINTDNKQRYLIIQQSIIVIYPHQQ